VLTLSISLRPKYGTPYLFTSYKHTLPPDVILRRATFFQPILPPSGPCNAPNSLPRLWRYINLLLKDFAEIQRLLPVVKHLLTVANSKAETCPVSPFAAVAEMEIFHSQSPDGSIYILNKRLTGLSFSLTALKFRNLVNSLRALCYCAQNFRNTSLFGSCIGTACWPSASRAGDWETWLMTNSRF